MKKIIFITAVMGCSLVSFATAITPASWKKGSGTEKKPFLIETAEQLYYLAIQVNNGEDYEHTYFLLSNDIDLKGEKNNQWQPVGTETRPFKGNFNGNNFEISNLYIDSPASDYVGLFGYVHSGQIENVCVAITGFVAGKDYVGGIVGYQMEGRIYNCYNKAAVNGNNNTGGIVGYQYSTAVSSCCNAGEVTGNWYIGGIIGTGYAKTDISNCYNIGNVYGKNYTGGIIGKIEGHHSYKTKVRNCYQESVFNRVGIIGMGINIECSNCYYATVASMGIAPEKFGEAVTRDHMKTDTFLMKLNNGENTWMRDKTPCVNSGYPVIASLKYSGVFTNEASDIAEKEAVLHGSFIAENEQTVQKGFEYKAKEAEQFTAVSADADGFSIHLTNLTPYTKYEFRAFVLTVKGKTVGRTVEFGTPAEKCNVNCSHKHHEHHHEHHKQ